MAIATCPVAIAIAPTKRVVREIGRIVATIEPQVDCVNASRLRSTQVERVNASGPRSTQAAKRWGSRGLGRHGWQPLPAGLGARISQYHACLDRHYPGG